MKLVLYTNSISPHQLPLARELVARFGLDEYLYLYTTERTSERADLGWNDRTDGIHVEKLNQGNRHWLVDAEVVMSGVRDFDLFERRVSAGRLTIYSSERWFKPIRLFSLGGVECSLPGWCRLFHPRYFRMAQRIANLQKGSKQFWYFPMGVWAERDMQQIGRLFRIKRLNRVRVWGYYVEPRLQGAHALPDEKPLGMIRLLWVGRLLGWKRVDDIVRAVRTHNRLRRSDDSLAKITLDIYGHGPEENRICRLIGKLGVGDLVKMHPPVPIEQVRKLMQDHDVYVLPSNAYEGWGAVVSEALEEGMKVVGTYEAGASATILPETNLYHAGDWRRLAELLRGDIPRVDIGRWTAKNAAKRLVEMFGK